jgi:hypothetical protein
MTSPLKGTTATSTKFGTTKKVGPHPPYPLDFQDKSQQGTMLKLNPDVIIQSNNSGRNLLVKKPKQPNSLDRLVNGYEGNMANQNSPKIRTVVAPSAAVTRTTTHSNRPEIADDNKLPPIVRMTPNFYPPDHLNQIVGSALAPVKVELDSQPQARAEKAELYATAMHMAELKMTHTKRQQAKQRLQMLQQENDTIYSQLRKMQDAREAALALSGNYDTDFTGDGTSLDKYVKELTFYKRFAGPASVRTQYMKFKG